MSIMSLDGLKSSANAVAQSLLQTKAATTAAGAAAASGSATSASTANPAAGNAITSSDFLTLLVTEMKNQDPTQPTDPNAYIQQLVGVNSLQELISINQTLSSDATAAIGTSAGSVHRVAAS